MVKFFTQYDKSPLIVRKFSKPSLTDPSFGKECDIGFMIENYRVNKIPLPTVNVQYGNSPSVNDYVEAQTLVADLKTQFESLPSKERDIFGNVQNYLQFIGNPNNLKECYERGLIDRSSVDLKDVYPEKYGNTQKLDLSVENPSVDTSLQTNETVNANS